MGCPVMSLESALKQFADAYFIITNAAHSDAIQKQLQDYGVDEQRVTEYNLSTFPMDCTNMIMRLKRFCHGS